MSLALLCRNLSNRTLSNRPSTRTFQPLHLSRTFTLGPARAAMAESTLNHTTQTFTLNTSAKIPAVGLGTWQSSPGAVRSAVSHALKVGYRHIDTAFAYQNEREVGLGIVDSGVPRSEIWITTKLDNDRHKRVSESLDTSLKNLGVDYVDLYLVHWPCSVDSENGSWDRVYADWDYVDTWLEMQKLPASGRVRNIGVSNFGPKHLERVFAHPEFKITPAVNQIELHPNCPSPKYLEYCKAKGIHVTAYSCLGSTDSPLYEDAELKALAEKKGKTVQQVLLMWGLARGTSVIPKSVTDSRIKANFDLDGWSLSPDEVKQLSSMKGRFKVCGEAWLPEPHPAIFHGDDE